jgi:hypothetical protein
MMLIRLLAANVSIDAFHTKPSRRFVESPRKVDNRIRGSPINRDMLMILKNILEELGNFLSIILEDSTNLLEVLAPFAALLGGPLTLKKGKLEKCGLNCQSFL